VSENDNRAGKAVQSKHERKEEVKSGKEEDHQQEEQKDEQAEKFNERTRASVLPVVRQSLAQ